MLRGWKQTFSLIYPFNFVCGNWMYAMINTVIYMDKCGSIYYDPIITHAIYCCKTKLNKSCKVNRGTFREAQSLMFSNRSVDHDSCV